MSEELKLCPMKDLWGEYGQPHDSGFVAAPKVRRVPVMSGSLRYRVDCGCGIKGPVRDSREEAAAAWNTRPDSQQIAALKAQLAELHKQIDRLHMLLKSSDDAVIRLTEELAQIDAALSDDGVGTGRPLEAAKRLRGQLSREDLAEVSRKLQILSKDQVEELAHLRELLESSDRALAKTLETAKCLRDKDAEWKHLCDEIQEREKQLLANRQKEIDLLKAQLATAQAELTTFRDGDNYIKQFLDAKEKCAAMYPPEEVYSKEQLGCWAEENGYLSATNVMR